MLWNPSPGRLGYALRMACACTVVILVCEIWQVPDAAVPALVTLALWQKDRVTNAIAGIAVNLLFAVVIFLMFGLVHLTLDHPLALVSAVALLSLLFFFLGSASKLKPVSYMLALVVIYAMIVIDQAPIGEIATRALLYADLFILVPGACMVFLGALICPSPKTLLTQDIAARLRISAQLLAAPSTILQEQAEDLLREGAGSMTKYLKLSKLEKLWSQKDLSCLHCALYNSIGVLTLCLATSRTPPLRKSQVKLYKPSILWLIFLSRVDTQKILMSFLFIISQIKIMIFLYFYQISLTQILKQILQPSKAPRKKKQAFSFQMPSPTLSMCALL
ncbi:fusaric acid resistance protein [Acetobacter orientalis]|uniref:Fusaric acid resistance protein n=1 Tax=Acetobacter orientalis TaxID=146474 RepID=A0A2Z5ZI84_9PROT|nr:fusaric acid resistance protein [Acetobacter orientalis]